MNKQIIFALFVVFVVVVVIVYIQTRKSGDDEDNDNNQITFGQLLPTDKVTSVMLYNKNSADAVPLQGPSVNLKPTDKFVVDKITLNTMYDDSYYANNFIIQYVDSTGKVNTLNTKFRNNKVVVKGSNNLLVLDAVDKPVLSGNNMFQVTQNAKSSTTADGNLPAIQTYIGASSGFLVSGHFTF